MSIEYAVVIKNKTRLEALVERFNTRAQARFYIGRSGGEFADYELEHDRFQEALLSVQRELSGIVRYKIVDRSFLPSFIFSDQQVVVAVGQDGLVANAAKYVNGRPIVAVNPDQDRYDGVLLPFTPVTFGKAVEKVIRGRFESRQAAFAEARLNDGQRLLAFNDLFIGASSHVSARYKITFNGTTEEHSSSGVIVSTQAGSTGWMSSIFNQSDGLQRLFEKSEQRRTRLNMRDDQLFFAVREPFRSKRTQTGIAGGLLSGDTRLRIESLMPGNGVIFSDGIEADFLRFGSGSIATIGPARERANLVVA
ncbi:MAG: NAD(+)/NADH kinase [Lewinellaceae bacterium]|nr:NAD(+)/NADH kinase [Lewinellaceae bacterium]